MHLAGGYREFIGWTLLALKNYKQLKKIKYSNTKTYIFWRLDFNWLGMLPERLLFPRNLHISQHHKRHRGKQK